VWTLATDRSVYVVEHADGTGNSVVTILLDDLDAPRRSARQLRSALSASSLK
jgi:hypothetical protein